MASVISGQLIGRLSSKTSFTRVEYTTNDCMAWNFFSLPCNVFFKIKGLNLPLDFMFTCPNYDIATYIVKYKFAQSCKSKVAGSVSLRCWPEVLLCGVVERDGYDIKRSNPLISCRILTLSLNSTELWLSKAKRVLDQVSCSLLYNDFSGFLSSLKCFLCQNGLI